MNRRQRAAWGLVIGGFVLISVLYVVTLMIAPWDVWSSTSAEPENAPMTPADILDYVAVITTAALVLVVPWISIPAGWAGAALLPLPMFVSTLVTIEVTVQVNPDMNMASLLLILPIMLSGFALLVVTVATIADQRRRAQRATTMTVSG